MPTASEILNDPFMARYGQEDMFKVYYTCFPVDKQEKLYECLKGKFDGCYSDKYMWIEPTWKTVSVPKVLPLRYHLPYTQFKTDVHILKIHHDK
jgi:hypothetical protein